MQNSVKTSLSPAFRLCSRGILSLHNRIADSLHVAATHTHTHRECADIKLVFIDDLLMIQTTYSTDCYHHPPQHHNATILEPADTHSSYLSTTLDCWTLTFSLECFTKTVISIL